jgi:two-component system sensor histidine kinase KdpD
MLWATAGTVLATACFWLVRSYLDKGQASLLYLPVVIALAVRYGFAPAVLAALLSFLCWNFFFLPPYYTFVVEDPRDWLSLIVFLLTAVTTAHLASQARLQAETAKTREQETLALYQASEAISNEVDAARLLPALAERVVEACEASCCAILRRSAEGRLAIHAVVPEGSISPEREALIVALCEAACERDQVIGFGSASHLWAKAVDAMSAEGLKMGACIPLRVENALVGALYAGPRADGKPFPERDQRIVLALANHAAVVIARQALADEAAQATALREADSLKDALLSMVTHELRTPLAAIKAASSGLRQRHSVWPEEAREEAIAAIDLEADRLTTLVSNLLDLSRLEAGSWNPNKDWCDMAEIVGTALDRLSERDAARVHVSAPDDLPLVRADYVQIALVLTNLLENAAKYTPPGSGILVTLSACADDEDALPSEQGRRRCGVRVIVRDHGAGIAPGDEEAIFERFYRSPRHANSAVHGTGLGLALCRAIVDAHGGWIKAGNAPVGEEPGAVFTLVLPVE